MSRTASGASLTEASSESLRALLLVELDWPSIPLRVNSSDRDIVFESNTYAAVGQLGTISPIGETGELRVSGLELALSGIDSANVAHAFENAQGRAGKVWVGFLDASYALVADPVLMFEGLIDTVSVEVGETATVRVTLENRLVAWERPKVRRYTNEDQQQRWGSPVDQFLEFVAQTVDKELLWGIPGNNEQVPREQSTQTSGFGGDGSVSTQRDDRSTPLGPNHFRDPGR